MERLRSILRRIHGRGYPAYKELQGREFRFPFFTLYADHIQGDPFASPSRFRVRVPRQVAGFPPEMTCNPSRSVALRDFLVRAFWRSARRFSERRGSGKSGAFLVDPPGQEVLERSACQLTQDWVELRFRVGLPAQGRRVLADEAEEMLVEALPRMVEEALLLRNLDREALWRHLLTGEDADALRSMLDGLGLVAFVADGSLLPRRSGVDDRPLPGGVPFRSPPSLRVEVRLPNRGRVTGMGIPKGVTLIVGGGFHGKSTLLRALERGVYNHIPGDGRELVVADPTAVKVRAEDGRSVVGVDISPFIAGLPGGVDTRFFTTENASGSTSQASAIVEAVEAGARTLLLDEDTSATNFLIRDRRMQALVPKAHEPITPFLDQVRNLYRDLGVSTVMVMGGSGDYLDVADTVIGMVEFLPVDLTGRAKEVAGRFPTGRLPEGTPAFAPHLDRYPLPRSLSAEKGRREVYLKARGTRTLLFGRREVDLSALEQIVEDGQVLAIGYALVHLAERYLDGRTPLREALRLLERDLERGGLDLLSPVPYPPDLVRCRVQEVALALDRLRGLEVVPRPPA